MPTVVLETCFKYATATQQMCFPTAVKSKNRQKRRRVKEVKKSFFKNTQRNMHLKDYSSLQMTDVSRHCEETTRISKQQKRKQREFLIEGSAIQYVFSRGWR